MNKPIVQLVVFLLIIVFATFVLIKFNSFYKEKELEKVDPIKMLLPQKKAALMNLRNKKSITDRNIEINLYRSIGLIKSDLAKGKYNKAENNLRNLLLFYPNNKTVLSLLGGVLYSEGNYAQAHNMFVLILKKNPNSALARESVGIALKKQHRYSEAIEEFLYASLLKPKSASLYLHLAGLYSIVGNKKQAIYNFAKAYEIIGVNIIPLSFDPAFNNIRDMPAFIRIFHKAEKKALEKK